jgi:hypothetical protein
MSEMPAFLTASNKLHGPSLVGAVQHGVLAATWRELSRAQNAERMWLDCKPSDVEGMELDPLRLVEFLVFSKQGFLWRLQPQIKKLLKEVLESLGLPDEVASLEEWMLRSAVIPRADVPTTASLFRGDISNLSWEKCGAGMSHLVADFPKIVDRNLVLFACGSAKNAARYVRGILTGPSFKRRYERLLELCAERPSPIKPFLLVEPGRCRGDALVFSIFLRCCSGAAADVAVAKDALQDALIGLGDYGTVSDLLAEAMASTATEEERSSFGLGASSQKEALDRLAAQVASAIERVEDVIIEAKVAKETADHAEEHAASAEKTPRLTSATPMSGSVPAFLTASQKLHGPFLVGAIQHGVLASTWRELSRGQYGDRMWQVCKPADIEGVEPLYLRRHPFLEAMSAVFCGEKCGAGMSHLMADFSKIIDGNRTLFECSATNTTLFFVK